MSARFAIRFVSEKGRVIERPVWAVGVRNKDYGSYVGIDWRISDQPQHAKTWAKATTAAEWAKRMTGDGTHYVFEVVPAPEGSS